MSHIVKIKHHYHYRARVPVDLLRSFGRKEVKKSLRTDNYRIARFIARQLDYRLEVILMVARMMILTDDQIKQIVDGYFHETLQRCEELRILGQGTPADEDGLSSMISNHEEIIREQRKALAYNRFDPATQPLIGSLLLQHKITAPKPLDYTKLSREIVKAQLQISAIEIERIGGNYDNWYDRDLRARAMVGSQIAPKSSTLLSEVIKLHKQEKMSTGKWTTKTQQENEAIYSLFLEILGDRAIGLFNDRKTFVDYVGILATLPPNLNKRREYRGKPVHEVLEMVRRNPVTPMMIRTRNKHMERISTLMDWAAENGYVAKNFAMGLLAKEEREDEEKRYPYSREDLMKLYSSPIYATRMPFRRPERFWVPLISPFSGIREDEICQFYTEDIKTVDGIPCFDINEEKDKKLKTPACRRILPIHPVLIRIGFLRYVDECRRKGQERLWPGLSRGKNGYSTAFEHWYTKYNRKYVSQEREKVFHSGRHLVSHTLKNAEVDLEIREAILGHEENALSRRYGKTFKPRVLLRALKKLDYADVVEHLRWPL